MGFRGFGVAFSLPLYFLLASRRIFLAYAAGKIRVADSQKYKVASGPTGVRSESMPGRIWVADSRESEVASSSTMGLGNK